MEMLQAAEAALVPYTLRLGFRRSELGQGRLGFRAWGSEDVRGTRFLLPPLALQGVQAHSEVT